MKKKLKNLKPLIHYFKEHKLKLTMATIILFIAETLFAIGGYLIGTSTQNIIDNNTKTGLIYLGIYFAINIVGVWCSQFAKYHMRTIQNRIIYNMSKDTYLKMLKLPAVAFEDMSSGEIINRINNDVWKLLGFFTNVVYTLSETLVVIIVWVIILLKSPLLAFYITVIMVLFIILTVFFTKRLNEANKKVNAGIDKVTALTSESAKGIREIKTLGIAYNLFKEVEDKNNTNYCLEVKASKITAIYNLLSYNLRTIIEVGTIFIAMLLMIKGKANIAFFIAMTYYVYRFSYLIEFISNMMQSFSSLYVAMNRIGEILNNTLYQDVSYGSKTIDNAKGIIEFKNVTFAYPNEDKIFKDFNIRFEPNKKIAIVGPSGEGKTTIFNLLTRIFDPHAGSITLDGTDIRELTEASLRQNISIIRQEPFLFNKPIIDNFRLLKSDCTLEEVKEYCQMASIDKYIETLPLKYDTILGEGGVNLSGGQKQRLAIARTLMKKSKVILFDEATSALDNESQECIKKSIDKLAKDHTVLIVAHRLSTIIDADLIYVIKAGRVLAMGTHQELMKSCDLYKNLYAKEDLTD